MPLCPPERDLELLLEEGLPEVERGSAEAHVESCAQCQATLQRLVTEHPSAVHAQMTAALADADPAPTSADVAFLRRLASSARCAPAPAEVPLPDVAGYEVLEQIGRGAVGTVYRARDLELNRLVALKLIPAGPFSSPQARQRFRIESQAIARLRHPHIVQVYGIGEQDGCLYLSLELVEGGNLADALAEGPRRPAEAAQIVADLAEAVAYAHSHGVIHRDLKPANVLLCGSAGGSGADGRHGAPRLPSGELKITDFGIAKVSAEDGPTGSGLTRSGEFLGTPSYTAPEQARGDARQVGPEADVYSLGAILYELLTGRPPFHGPSVVETLLQVAHHVAVPPARLVPGVPRDLDTICSKCLEKSPAKRYATAGELAADLRRFLKREPILARRIGAAERTLRWARRRPSEAGLVAGGILVALALLGAGLWMGLQSAAREREVVAHLQDLEQRAGLADWDGARTALERAKARLGDGGDDALQRRVEQGARDLQLVARLDAIRSNRAALTEGQEDVRENKARAEREYAQAFLEAGFGQVHDDAGLVAGRMRASQAHRALIAACDDWALCSVADAGRAAWIQEVARQADPDPTGWLGRARDPAAWKDRAALEELARTSAEAQPSVELLVALGERLGDAGGDPVPFLQQVQRERPDDFWANLVLGDVLSWHRPAESIRYYQAAMALRPEEAVVYNNLSRALAAVGNTAEAVEHLRLALRIDPRFARAHSNLGLALGLQGRRSEAVEACREAVRIAPESAAFRSNLGRALVEMERWGEAVDELEQAVELDPAFAFAHGGLCHALRVVGRLDEAIEHGEIALRLAPDEAAYHNNLGAALKAQGRLDEAVDHLQQAIELAPGQVEAHANLCDALRAQGRLDEAIDIGERALQLDPDSKGAHSHLGMALAQKGRPDEACMHFELALAVDPDNPELHNNLAIGLQAAGRLDEAIEHYQRALEINPELARSYGALSLALATQKRWKEAREAAERFLELSQPNEPGRGTAQRTLELCERMLALEAAPSGDL